MAAAEVDRAADLFPIVDMSEAGNDRNKVMTPEEAAKALAGHAITASEALGAATFVNVHASGGAKIRKANAADDTKPVDGFAPAAIANGDVGLMLPPGRVVTGLAGLTPGARYFLAAVAGTITDTPPSAGGNLVQEVGVAVSATELLFNPKQGVTL